jgi:hypothetical protein
LPVSVSAVNTPTSYTPSSYTPGSGIGGRSRVITLRPIGQPNEPGRIEQPGQIAKPGQIDQAGRIEQTQRTDAIRRNEPARSGTAYQTNADGDSVTLSSKLDQLTDDERREVEKLKARDTEVRTHEQAHVSAAGSLFRGGPYYQTKKGPDGNDYAVAGKVNIDTSPGKKPEETIAKAQKIRQAALAPAEPSGTDRRVAAKASAMEANARKEMAEQEATKGSDGASGSEPVKPGEAPNKTDALKPASLLETFTADGSTETKKARATSPSAAAGVGELKLDLYA